MGIIASVILHDIFRREHGNVAFPVFLLDLFFRYNAQRLVIRGIGRDTQAFKVSLGTDPGGAVLSDVQFINIIIKLFRCLSEGFFFFLGQPENMFVEFADDKTDNKQDDQ